MKTLNIKTSGQLPDLRVRNPLFYSKSTNSNDISLYAHGTQTLAIQLNDAEDSIQLHGEMNLSELDVAMTTSETLVIVAF